MKIFPHTTLTWPDPSDAPNADATTIDDAHLVYHGNRLTIRRPDEKGRKDLVDTIIEATMKGSGKNTTVTGKSTFMMNTIGLNPADAEVTVTFDGGNSKCSTC